MNGLAVNCFRKNARSWMFGSVVKTPLPTYKLIAWEFRFLVLVHCQNTTCPGNKVAPFFPKISC